jgi:hypothetical protein
VDHSVVDAGNYRYLLGQIFPVYNNACASCRLNYVLFLQQYIVLVCELQDQVGSALVC